MPEPLLFALKTLQSFCSRHSEGACQPRGWSLQWDVETGSLPLADTIPLAFDAPERKDASPGCLAVSCVNAALGLLDRAAAVFAEVPSFPELFSPAVAACKQLAVLQSTLPQASISSL